MGGTDWHQGEPPSTSGSALIGVALSLSVLQILFVAARFYTRTLQHTQCGADDYLILVALGFYALELLGFAFTITLAKLSLLLFYVRIFYVRILNSRKFLIITYVIGALVLGLGIAVLFVDVFQCSPIAAAWNPNLHGSCVNLTIFYRAISPINVLTGLMIAVLPIPLVWRLHAPRGQKVALTGVFLLSGLQYPPNGGLLHKLKDANNPLDLLGIYSMIETSIIIIATCLVSIWPLFTHLLAKFSCCRSRGTHHHHHHHLGQWYTHSIPTEPTEPTVPKIDRPVTYEENYIQREVSWSSRPSSLAELEVQRSWNLEDEEEGSRHQPWVSYEVHITAGS
ncbi:hypothetical protein N7486_001896 [Penicillium sp. IBT 16267x]|nr:hypothetical protein N7486_001896 [Penicillium sp. IBT 16267x]